MRYHYVWLLWSLAFLGLWGVLFLANPGKRRAMWRTSLVTALFGVTEPLFVPRYWNPPSLFELAQRTGFDIESFIFLLALALGALAAVVCRPDLTRNTLVGAVLFLGLYALFMLGLRWLAPGYIEAVWNLPALSGGLVYGIPLEELVFGLTFGMYWSGVYEHVTWHASGLRMLNASQGGSHR